MHIPLLLNNLFLLSFKQVHRLLSYEHDASSSFLSSHGIFLWDNILQHVPFHHKCNICNLSSPSEIYDSFGIFYASCESVILSYSFSSLHELLSIDNHLQPYLPI